MKYKYSWVILVLIAAAGSACVSNPELPGLFANADTNHDGLVSMNEWQQLGMNDIAFLAVDRLNRGSLTESKFYEALRLDQQSRSKNIQQEQMNNSQLVMQIKDVLNSSSGLNGYAIEVNSSNGVVTLAGSVRTQNEKQKAESITWTVRGVSQVLNSITVKY